MYLYLLKWPAGVGYDYYDSLIVAAETAEAAKRIATNGSKFTKSWGGEWASKLSDIKVSRIGKAAKNLKAGVILASFNAS